MRLPPLRSHHTPLPPLRSPASSWLPPAPIQRARDWALPAVVVTLYVAIAAAALAIGLAHSRQAGCLAAGHVLALGCAEAR